MKDQQLSPQQRRAIELARWVRENCKRCPICKAMACDDFHTQWHQNMSDLFDLVQTRIAQARAAILDLQTRMSAAEAAITALDGRLTTAEAKLTNHETRIAALEARVP